MRDVDVFLFDEPLSNLDAKLRAELRVEIKRLHRRLQNTMIYVTHDQIEAMTLADRIAVMKGGVIQQLDAPQTIYNRPVNRFVAGFLGSPAMNFLDGQLEAGASRLSRPDDVSVPLDRYAFDAARQRQRALRARHPARAHRFRRRRQSRCPFPPSGAVEIVEPMGSDTLVWTKLGGHNFSFRVEAEKTLRSRRADPDRLRSGARLAVRRRHRQPHVTPKPLHTPIHQAERTETMNWSFQLYSARNFQPWEGVLQTLGKLGYTQVEGFGGVYDDPEGASAPNSTRTGLPCRPGISRSMRSRTISTACAKSPKRSASRWSSVPI